MNHLRSHLGRAWKRARLARPIPSPELVRRIFPWVSNREAAVLFWITEEKQNRDIATPRPFSHFGALLEA